MNFLSGSKKTFPDKIAYFSSPVFLKEISEKCFLGGNVCSAELDLGEF